MSRTTRIVVIVIAALAILYGLFVWAWSYNPGEASASIATVALIAS